MSRKTKSLRSEYDECMLPVYSPPSPVFVSGKGSRVYDEKGREYIDFGGGIAVLSLGHGDKELSKALCEQSKKLMHVSNLHANEVGVRLARKLVELTFAERVFLSNSGGEANEAALKIARHRGVGIDRSKYGVLSFRGGFHGRIGLGMSATHASRVRRGFGRLSGGFRYGAYNDLSEAAKKTDERTCAIIVESIQGEGGVREAERGFIEGLRELSDRRDALLILDEVQTGVGRCGELYDYMRLGVKPDILTSGKGLGGGFPLGATLCNGRAWKSMTLGSHGSTFGGNALGSRAGLIVLERLKSSGFMEGVKRRGAEMKSRLNKLSSELGCIREIRGRGLLLGAELKAGMSASEVSLSSLSSGLVLITASGNTLRFAPSLTIGRRDIEEGFDILEKVLKKSIMKSRKSR